MRKHTHSRTRTIGSDRESNPFSPLRRLHLGRAGAAPESPPTAGSVRVSSQAFPAERARS